MTAWSAKRSDELDLFFAEWPHFRSAQHNDADWCPSPQQRHAENRAVVAEPSPFQQRVFGVGKSVGDMSDLASLQDATLASPPPRLDRTRFGKLDKITRKIVVRRVIIGRALLTQNRRTRRIAQTRGRLCQCGEYGLKIEGRAADDL